MMIQCCSIANTHKKGTTNPSNLNKHQKGQTRKQRDNRGEKGDARHKPNPNKQPKYSVSEKIISSIVVLGASVAVVYFAVNDLTIVGTADDAAIVPMIPIIWDNVQVIVS